MKEEARMVLKRPRNESATKPQSKGKRAETPVQVLTFMAALVFGISRAFVRYVMRFPDKPKYANLSANSTPTKVPSIN